MLHPHYRQHLIMFGKRRYNSRNRHERILNRDRRKLFFIWRKNDNFQSRLLHRTHIISLKSFSNNQRGWLSRFEYILINTPIY